MNSRFQTVLFALALFAAVALAVPQPAVSPTPPSPPTQPTCTGVVQCCQSTGHANDGIVGLLLGLLGVVVKDLTILIGVTCSPISAGLTCSQQVVCCTNNGFNGVIALGCSPYNQ